MMENNKQPGQHTDGAVYSTSQEVSSLCSELSSCSRRLAELGANIIGNKQQS
ncbi:kazrin-like isoform X1, partial [Clarias magur]